MVNRRERYRFLSTPSARRATRQIFHRAVGELISIHALREEGDLEKLLFCLADRLFLSTPSARRATQSGRPDRDRCVISIHALREEGDHRCRRRYSDRYRISIHALREEGDCIFWVGRRESMISIHALREEGDL